VFAQHHPAPPLPRTVPKFSVKFPVGQPSEKFSALHNKEEKIRKIEKQISLS